MNRCTGNGESPLSGGTMSPCMKHEVFWQSKQAGVSPYAVKRLEKNISADAVVVGAGMAGLMCAQKLSDAGLSVIVIERDRVGCGASGKTSGFITPDSELELSDLVRNVGPKEAKRLWGFVTDGLEAARKNIEKYGITCDYQKQDSLFIANNAKGFDVVKNEHEGRVKLGYKSKLYDGKTIRSVIGSEGYAGGVRYPGTYGMNAYLYCLGMKKVLEKQKVAVYEDTAMASTTKDGIKTTKGHVIKAKHVIVCTDRWLPELKIIPRDVYHAQTFLSISKPLKDADVKRIFPKEKLMVWDTDLIYQYFRVTGDNRLLLGAASMFYTYDRRERKTPQRIVTKMQNYLKNKFPWLKAEIEFVWPGLIGVSKDFVPIAARDAKNPRLHYVSACAGLPWASAIGRYIAETITDGRKDFDKAFTPNRAYPPVCKAQPLLGKPNTFALSHGFVKYFR